MIPRERGQNFSSNREGRERTMDQYGQQRLIAADITNIASSSTGNIPQNDSLFKEFLEFKKQKEQQDNTICYDNIATEEENDDSFTYEKNFSKEIILFLENKDLQWQDEPWTLMQRYFDEASYAAGSYKQRSYYENILMTTGSCDITHFYSTNSRASFNFSKIIIKRIISAEEWGISTLREKEYFHQELKIPIKFNYWDYIEAFNKALLCENHKGERSWFIKVCSEVYKRELPSWFHQWWIDHGPSPKIFPEPFKLLFTEWANCSPKLINMEHCNRWSEGVSSLHFFVEFSIPWIWKWAPEVDYTPDNIPCLRRVSFTKFWSKPLLKDREAGAYHSHELIDLIQKRIVEYRQQIKMKQRREFLSYFQHIIRRIQMQKGDVSNQELVESYFEEIKKDLIKNLEVNIEADNKFDTSMATSSKEEDQFTYLVGESQDPYEEEDPTIGDIFESIKEAIKDYIKKKEGSASRQE